MEVHDLLKRAQNMLVTPSPPKVMTSSKHAAAEADDWVDIHEMAEDTYSGWSTPTSTSTSSVPGSPTVEPAGLSLPPLTSTPGFPSPAIAASVEVASTDTTDDVSSVAAAAAAAPESPPQLPDFPSQAQAEKQKAVTAAAAAAGFSESDLQDLMAMMKDMKGDIGHCTKVAEQALATQVRTGAGGRGNFAWRINAAAGGAPPPVAPAPAPTPPLHRGPALDISDALEVDVDFDHEESTKEGFVITLKPTQGGRGVRLYVGEFEGSSLVRALNNKLKTAHGRPMTYDFMKSSLTAIGYKVAAVVVTAFENNTYHAMVHYASMDCVGMTAQVDARPSDALNLALRSGASVYVSKKVLAR